MIRCVYYKQFVITKYNDRVDNGQNKIFKIIRIVISFVLVKSSASTPPMSEEV